MIKFLTFLAFTLILTPLKNQGEETKDSLSIGKAIISSYTAPLKVTHISPVGSTEGIRESFKILVGFNQPMTSLRAVPREETEGPLEIDPPVSGKYRWLGTKTLAFIPYDTLAPATEFKVTLNKSKIQSLTGMRLERDTSWTFETVRPLFLKSYPRHRENFVDCEGTIYLYFNLEMSPDKVNDEIQIIATHGKPSKSCGYIEPVHPKYGKEIIPFRVRNLEDSEKERTPLRYWENERTLVLEPPIDLPVESQIDVYLYPGLTAKHGNLGLGSEKVITFNTYNVFRLISYPIEITASDALWLFFSNPVSTSELIENIEIEPEVEIPDRYRGHKWSANRIWLDLPFKPHSEYKITISGRLKDKFDNYLDKDYEFILKVNDYEPYIEIPTGVNIVESRGSLRYPVTFLNVDSVYLELARIECDNAVPFIKEVNFSPRKKYVPTELFDIRKYWKVNTYKNYRNKRTVLPIELKDILEGDTGLVFIQLDDLGQTPRTHWNRYMKAFLMVSDVGVTWKYSPENNLVWVTSLNSTEPLKGVNIQLRDGGNKILWRGQSNENGLCEFPGWAKFMPKKYDVKDRYYGAPELWLTLQNGGSAVFSNLWNFGIEPWRFNIWYRWNIKGEEYGAYIFTEKGLYRAGETVHIKGIMRKKRGGMWILPDIDSIPIRIKNSRGEDIFVDTLKLNSYGSFFKDLPLSEDAPTGLYLIKVSLPEKNIYFTNHFRVEAYRPAEFEVKVSAERDTFIVDEGFWAEASGKYLFGMPMKDAPVSWNLRKRNYRLRYSQYEAYTFGKYEVERDRKIISSGKGNLNDDGLFSARAKLSSKDIKAPSKITFEATVTASNKRTVSGRQNWIALPANLLLGLKTSEYLYILGDTVKTSMIAIKPSGEKVTGVNVSIRVIRMEWRSIKKARFGRRYEWVSENIEIEKSYKQVNSSGDSTLIRFVPDEPGYYSIIASAKDERSRKTSTKIYFYVTGRGFAGWEMRDDDIIELVPDKEVYEVGDTARILVKSPYDSTNALVTMERELVLNKFITKIRGNADYIEIPIDSTCLPNIYVGVTLIRGRVKELAWDAKKETDLGKPQFKIGYANLKVDAKEKHLAVSVWSEEEEYRPGDSVTVNFTVDNYKGEPVDSAELALFVVDLGVLNLIDFKTPEPFDYFYGMRPLSVRTVESRLHIIGERNYGEKGEEHGGGGGLKGISYREKFITTAYYEACILTDESGKGSATFILPDNLTKFRIMAVAQTKNSQFGSAESHLTVNLPFILTPSLPRFARVDDEFEAGIVVHNRTDKSSIASIECEAEGIKLIGENSHEFMISPNESKEALFKFKAEREGEAAFKFNGRMGKEEDALKVTLPVKNPPFNEAVATFSAIDDSIIESIYAPSNTFENLGELEILLSSSILAGMENGIKFLLDFPYECLEQRLSKIFPLIVGEDIINDFKLAPITGQTLRDTVQGVLDEVGEYQVKSGGFVYYKDGLYPAPYLSAYTMYVLKRAKDNGYLIDSDVTIRGKRYLRNILRLDKVDWNYPYNEYAKLTSKAFCLYVLALWDDYDKAYASRLFEHREQLSVFGKTLLLKAGRELGMGNEFETELSRIILNKAKLSPTTAHFEESENRGWTFPSPGKVTAFVVQAFTELDMSFPYKDMAIKWLVEERARKARPTTHENAFVFDAFQTYYRKYEREEPDFTAKIVLSEREIVNQLFKGRTNRPPVRFSVPLDSIPSDTTIPIRISKLGEGRLYYVLRMIYALKESPIAFDEGFYVWKEILTLDDRKVEKFKRGKLYKVILHVGVPETRIFGIVDDPLPAGFEVVNPHFVTESEETRQEYREARRKRKRHWWGSFDHQEVYDDKVILVGKHMFPDEHTWIYFVKATTSGKFLLPATKAEEMYSPEVFGSTSQKFIVIE
ncbi:hypothetical protein CH333_04990 [candidate division WOR-3 bacterium JGI_Cruoil_03_44_89]|uniref:Alpha-2-macroglobulin n=1 Tax=candidate division WOR-3 bacterium JGI_Cruoil_03_44_89 TaxID=1973748 RepID=A0A235BU79_UNCW3|nr:MAG: hypothetical protein CH333_04990 [candidate division WOR-3 bacterium JGI_Cruoil_03_44_89]